MIEMIEPPDALSKVVVYNAIEAGITLLMAKHGGVLTTPPDVSTPTAMDKTKANRKEMVKFRTAIEAARKSEKEASLVYGRLVDSEAKRITAIAAPIESAYDAAITQEESRLEAIRQAELEAERRRVAGHLSRIQAIKDVREAASLCRTAEQLEKLIDAMPAMVVNSFEEFGDEAMTAFNEVCTLLGQLHGVKAEQEKAAAELAQQQAELARQQAEQARLDRERATQAAALKERADALAAREAEMARREAAAAMPVAENFATAQAGSAQTRKAFAASAETPPVVEAKNLYEVARPGLLDWGDLDESPTPAVSDATTAPVAKATRPADTVIIDTLAMHYRVHESTVLTWLMEMDFEASARRIESEFTGVQAADQGGHYE